MSSTSNHNYLDTPQSSFTSLYADANAARRLVSFESAALVALWGALVAVDGTDRLVASVRVGNSRVPAIVAMVGAVVELLAAAAALTLATAALYTSTRIAYYVTRAQVALVLCTCYAVCAHAAAAITSALHTADARALGAIATGAARAQLLLAPLLFTGCVSRIPFRKRAALALASPFLAGLFSLARTLTAVLRAQEGWILSVPSAGGRLPLLAFLAGVLLSFWAAAGLLATCSDDEQTMRVHVATAAPTLMLCIAVFCVVVPALAVAVGDSDTTSGFAGTGPTALCVLLSAAIGIPAYLLSQHVEDRRSRKIDSLDHLDAKFPASPPVAIKVDDSPPTPPSMPVFPPLRDPWGRWDPRWDPEDDDEYSTL